jgi:hypothetical protein
MKTPFQQLAFWVLSVILLPLSAAAVDGTYTVTERWTVTIEYDRFEGFTGTKVYRGTQTGTIRVVNGRYVALDRSGVAWASPGRNLKGRSMYYDGFSYHISGDFVFAPAYGQTVRGIVFLGAFVVSVPFRDGHIPAFYRYEDYSASGPLSSISGGGNMLAGDVDVYVESTMSWSPVPTSPALVDHPQNTTNSVGQNVTFDVFATGTEPLRYTWRKGSTVIPAATGPSLTITNVQLSDAGSYSVTVANAVGSVTSRAARLVVRPPPPAWFEGWELSPLGIYSPADPGFILGDKGAWIVVDTVSHFPQGCPVVENWAEIVQQDEHKMLKLVSRTNSDCAANISVEIDPRTPRLYRFRSCQLPRSPSSHKAGWRILSGMGSFRR